MGNEISKRNITSEIQETGFFSTVDASTMEGKKTLYKALNESTPLREHVGEVLSLKDVIVQEAEVTTEEGDVVTQPRTSLITEDGTVYAATSNGVFSAVRNIIGIFGLPSTWDGPLKVIVEEKATRRNSMYRYLTLSLA